MNDVMPMHPELMLHNDALQKLMYLASPALPVGGYAYSQGLEYAIDSGWLTGCADIAEWVGGILAHSIATLDLPVLARLYRCWQRQDRHQLEYWNHYLRAARETYELQLEDDQLGLALQRLLLALALPANNLKAPTYAAMYALAGSEWQLPLPALLQSFAWSWLENQIAAATKLMPLGQTQAQQLLLQLQPQITPACQKALQLDDQELGAGTPALAIASARHERQYSRLFRS